MANFAIHRGATALCTLDTDAGEIGFHVAAARSSEILVVGESDKLEFVLSPAPDETSFRISIGDVPLHVLVPPDDAAGVTMGGSHFWRAQSYFESARGATRVVLEARAEADESAPWKCMGVIDIYVQPSKLGDLRYDAMSKELQSVSRSLLVDLYGKSRQSHDLKYANEGKVQTSREQELSAIVESLSGASRLLSSIQGRPASRIVTHIALQRCWGGERLSAANLASYARSGVATQKGNVPMVLRTERRRESFDVPEHRAIKAFLAIIAHRARLCGDAARSHILAIVSEKHLRHVRLKPGATLYEAVDQPKIQRLQEAVAKSEQAEALAGRLAMLPFLQESKPELIQVRQGLFQRSGEYRAVFEWMRRFLIANAVWYSGSEQTTITKLTSRLFEQWCYLRVIEAFRVCGLELREWTDALRENLRSRFLLDFDRGLTFEGSLASDLRLRFRYEPWILGTESATKAGETLYRGANVDVAWSPDIIIECLQKSGNEWHPVYAIVLDSKYTPKIRDDHWRETSKYRQIRSTRAKKQIVRHLCLISPAPLGSNGQIVSDDPAVEFTSAGPSCPPEDAVGFNLSVVPTGDTEVTARLDVFQFFAKGMIEYLRRNFAT